MKELAVYGFGLIGASVAAAVRAASPHTRIVAIDLPRVFGRGAAGLADAWLDASEDRAVQGAVERADLCVVAAPVAIIEREAPRLLQWAQVLTDCGSTKRSICSAVASSARVGRFVPGHPMAGGPEGGAARARPELFQGHTWLLCAERSDPDAVAGVEKLIELVGAKVAHVSAGAHDRAVALTSHLPQLVASALAALASELGAEVAAGPAFRGATRTAGGAEVMWRDIFASNADEVARALRLLMTELASAADALEATPAEVAPALALLERARQTRRS